jgi:hypothetical protein
MKFFLGNFNIAGASFFVSNSRFFEKCMKYEASCMGTPRGQ